MTSIIRATEKHSSLILQIGQEAWVEAHGHSAPKKTLTITYQKTTQKMF